MVRRRCFRLITYLSAPTSFNTLLREKQARKNNFYCVVANSELKLGVNAKIMFFPRSLRLALVLFTQILALALVLFE